MWLLLLLLSSVSNFYPISLATRNRSICSVAFCPSCLSVLQVDSKGLRGLRRNSSCVCTLDPPLWSFPAVKYENVAEQIQACQDSWEELQQQVTDEEQLNCRLLKAFQLRAASEAFCCSSFLALVAGEFVRPKPPSDAAVNQEHHGPSGAPPVPSPPGPVLVLSTPPAG